MNYTYWIEKHYNPLAGHDTYTLRQTRYKGEYLAGKEHPHDVMAQGFDKEGILEIIEKYFPSTDISKL
ncbi:hypothetical protein D3C87_325000 [compost metagenome]